MHFETVQGWKIYVDNFRFFHDIIAHQLVLRLRGNGEVSAKSSLSEELSKVENILGGPRQDCTGHNSPRCS
jgi:hypothetical protein